MKHKLKDLAVILFYFSVAVYAVVLILDGATNIIYAQESRNYRLENLERRVAESESLKLDQRLTRVETILANFPLDSNNWYKYASDGGVGLLLLRALYMDVKKRRGFNE